MCNLASQAAAQPRASASVRGRAAIEGVIPRGCKLLPGDLLDLVHIEPVITKGEPEWNGWTEGSPTNRMRVTLYSEDIDAIRAAGYDLPRLPNQAADVAIPFYLGNEQDRFMWRIALVPYAPKPCIIECATGDLQPGDVIRQQFKSQTKGTVETLLEVVDYCGKVANQHKLTLKNLATCERETVHWSGGDQVLIAGPKVDAYAKDPTVCQIVRPGARPQWLAPEVARV